MTEYLSLGKLADFAEGEIYKLEVRGVIIDVVNLGGTMYAFSDACPHWGVSLASGYGYVTNRRSLVCMFHDSAFDLTSGAPIEGPAHDYLPVYDVRVDGDEVLIGWGDAEAGE